MEFSVTTSKAYSRGTWVAQSVKHLPSAQIMILGSWNRALHWAPCSERGLLLPLFPTHALLLSLSLSNFFLKKACSNSSLKYFCFSLKHFKYCEAPGNMQDQKYICLIFGLIATSLSSYQNCNFILLIKFFVYWQEWSVFIPTVFPVSSKVREIQ